jgi:hypothetical protein
MTRRTAIAIAIALAVASSALALSTVVMPQPGSDGYAVVPPRQGFTTQVLSDDGRGMVDRPAGGSGSQHDRPAGARRWLGRHGTIQCGSALLPGAAWISAMRGRRLRRPGGALRIARQARSISRKACAARIVALAERYAAEHHQAMTAVERGEVILSIVPDALLQVERDAKG